MSRTQADMPEWEKMGMTAEEFGQYLVDSCLREANYYAEKRKKRLKYRLTRIWYNGRGIVSLLFQRCRKFPETF